MITAAVQKTSQSVWVYDESGSARNFQAHCWITPRKR